MKVTMIQTSSLFFLLFVFKTALTDPISCPSLLCEEQNRTSDVQLDLCYEHDNQQPVRYLRMHTCEWYQMWGVSLLQGIVSCELDLQK